MLLHDICVTMAILVKSTLKMDKKNKSDSSQSCLIHTSTNFTCILSILLLLNNEVYNEIIILICEK